MLGYLLSKNPYVTDALRNEVKGKIVATQGVADQRWTSASLGYGEALQLDKIFRWVGGKGGTLEDWNVNSGKRLYNQDIEKLNSSDKMGDKYTFLYGVTQETIKMQDWSEFGVTMGAEFSKLSEIGMGATLAYVLKNPSSKVKVQGNEFDLGDSDGLAPVISMAGIGITDNSIYIGPVDHEQYFNSAIHAPKTADATYEAMKFSDKKCDCPTVQLTSPQGGKSFKPNEKIRVEGQLVWPGDDKPGKRIKQIQVTSSSSGQKINLNTDNIKDNGNFSDEFEAGDISKNWVDVATSALTVVLQFKDDTELKAIPSSGPANLEVTVIRSEDKPVCGEGNPPEKWPLEFTAKVTGGVPLYTYEWNYHGEIKKTEKGLMTDLCEE